MVDAESMDESVDDMTAAEIAPRPKQATAFGVRYSSTKGSTTCFDVMNTNHFCGFDA